MKRALLILGLGLGGCGGAVSSAWDANETASLQKEPEWMLKQIDSGSWDAMLSKMDPDSTVFDFDSENKPFTAHNLDEVRKFFAGYQDMMKTQQLTLKSELKSVACHATQVMGSCAIEFDQTITAGGKAMGPFKFRGTLVAKKDGDAWKWVHWHGSFREMPEMPAPPAAAAVPPTPVPPTPVPPTPPVSASTPAATPPAGKK